MEWNVWVIQPSGLLIGIWVMVLRRGRKHFHQVLCRSSDFSQLILLFYPSSCTTVFLNATWGMACEAGSFAVSESNTNVRRLNTCHNKHWPGQNPTKRWCCVFSEGHDANGDVHMCHVWHGTLCGPKLFCGLPHRKQFNNTSFHLSSVQTVKASTTM